MSIKAIFFSKFDPQQGPIVAHQVPPDSVLTSDLSSSIASHSTSVNNALLSFPTISRFLIPRQSLCGNLLTLAPPPLSSTTPPLILLFLPICLTSRSYDRNEFIFTFALALDPTADIPSYKSVLRKLTSLITSLEEQSHFLSSDVSPPNSGKIYSLCEMLMEDLNNYAECMIPIPTDDTSPEQGSLNTLNIKLFPTLPSPPKIQPWHVPLFVVRIETLIDENWDLTMQRIIPFINGVNSVKRIAGLADADLKLTRKCVKHLVYYGCALLLDIFSFNAIYAHTSQFTDMIARDEAMQRECARYCNTKYSEVRNLAEEAVVDERRLNDEDVWPAMADGKAIDGVGIVQLFANLKQGLTVREWYAQNAEMLAHIDMRRFVTFGVIKGFLYRVHRFAVKTGKGAKVNAGKMNGTRKRMKRRGSEDDDADDTGNLNDRLLPFLDGTHCFDEICTALEISERELIERVQSKELGEVFIICR